MESSMSRSFACIESDFVLGLSDIAVSTPEIVSFVVGQLFCYFVG